jgi:hypothetical protein
VSEENVGQQIDSSLTLRVTISLTKHARYWMPLAANSEGTTFEKEL